MLTHLHKKTEELTKLFLSRKTVGAVAIAFSVMMLGYPNTVTSYEFKVFGIDSWVFTLIGGGAVVLMTLPILMLITLNEILRNRQHFCSRGEPWPVSWFDLCDQREGQSCES